jgi:hypothetical protein
MTDKPNLLTLPGAGSAWLRHVVWALENNEILQSPGPNFHNTKKTQSMLHSHFATNNDIVLHGPKSIFNISLNYYTKYAMVYNVNGCNVTCAQERLNAIVDHLNYYLMTRQQEMANRKIDINYDYIFSDKQLFTSQLFDVLSSHNIAFTPRYDFVSYAIDKYKQTCINMDEIVENWENDFWLAWCIACSDINGITIPGDSSDLTKLVPALKRHGDFYLNELTKVASFG